MVTGEGELDFKWREKRKIETRRDKKIGRKIELCSVSKLEP